jgi:hypothetical protein
MTSIKDEIAELRAELAALKAPPKSREELDAECRAFQDEMHKMRERRANSWTPPSAIQELVNAENGMMREVAGRDARAPTGPSSAGAIPSSQQVSNVRGVGGGSGAPRPLGPQPGIAIVDAICVADDVRQRKGKV